MKNKIMLITYSDSFGKNLKELKQMVDTYFKREINGIHILPFFPSSGDRGFAPINYREVDPQFGTWEDIQALAEDYELMFDFMINHLSRRSPEFLDFLEKHDQSEYADMFLRFKKFWPNGEPDQKQVDMLNKRKPCAPCEDILFADGMTEKIWCTFDNEQMDLNLESETAWRFVEKTLRFLMDQGAAMIRLDAEGGEENTEGLDLVNSATRLDLLENKVTLAVPEGNPKGIESFDQLAGLLASGDVFLAMGNSDVPVGQYTQKIFTYYGLNEETLASSGVLTYGSNVKEVTTQVSEGTVDCGVIYATDAFSAGLTVVDEATAEMCGQVIYPAAVMKNSANPDAA